MRLRVLLCALFLCGGAFGQAESAGLKRQLQSALETGDLKTALRLATDGMTRWPRDADFPHLRGTVLFRGGQLDAAERDLRLAQSLAPARGAIAFDFGLLKMAKSDYDSAASQLERALKDPDARRRPIAHLMLGRAYQNSNRSERAVTEFQAALAADPKISLGHYHLGYAYQSLGDNERALSEYRKELALGTRQAEVHYRLGSVLLETGALQEAIPQLEKALALEPQNADAQYELGKATLLSGAVKKAVPLLQKAIELAPTSPDPHFQLARALNQIGDKDGAALELRKFSELKKSQPSSGGMATGRAR